MWILSVQTEIGDGMEMFNPMGGERDPFPRSSLQKSVLKVLARL
jgi:hypothetical protein